MAGISTRGNTLHALERRLARLEPPPSGARMHTVEASDEADADRLFKSLGAKAGDLCIWVKRYAEPGEEMPARHLYSIDMAKPVRSSRIVFEGADAEL